MKDAKTRHIEKDGILEKEADRVKCENRVDCKIWYIERCGGFINPGDGSNI